MSRGGWLRQPMVDQMVNQVTQPDRRSKRGRRTYFQQNPGRRAEDAHALTAWHPAARVAVVVMLGILGGINIWMDAAIQINSLPKLHVAVSPAKLGYMAPTAPLS